MVTCMCITNQNDIFPLNNHLPTNVLVNPVSLLDLKTDTFCITMLIFS